MLPLPGPKQKGAWAISCARNCSASSMFMPEKSPPENGAIIQLTILRGGLFFQFIALAMKTLFTQLKNAY